MAYKSFCCSQFQVPKTFFFLVSLIPRIAKHVCVQPEGPYFQTGINNADLNIFACCVPVVVCFFSLAKFEFFCLLIYLSGAVITGAYSFSSFYASVRYDLAF